MGVSTSPERIIAEPSKETSLRTDRLSQCGHRMSLFLQTLVLRVILSGEQEHRQEHIGVGMTLWLTGPTRGEEKNEIEIGHLHEFGGRIPVSTGTAEARSKNKPFGKAKRGTMNRSVRRVMMGVAGLAVLGMTATLAGAQNRRSEGKAAAVQVRIVLDVSAGPLV